MQQDAPSPTLIVKNVFTVTLQAIVKNPDVVQVEAHQQPGGSLVTFVAQIDPADYDWIRQEQDSLLTSLAQLAKSLGARYKQNFAFALDNPAFDTLFPGKRASL